MTHPTTPEPQHERPLDTWKEIAAYLNRTERTAKRWERHEGLPVRRHMHRARPSVYAYASELDAWLTSREPSSAAAALPGGAWWQRAIGVPAVLIVTLLSPGTTLLPNAASDQAPVMTERRLWAGDRGSMGAVSPDGRLIAEGFWNLSVRDLGTDTTTPLTGEPAGSAEFTDASIFSPDGRRIAYTWFAAPYELRIADVGGGSPRTLLQVPGARDYVLPLDWSADGRQILALLAAATGSELIVIDVETGDQRVLLSDPVADNVTHARFSPDGRFIAYNRQPGAAPEPDTQAPHDVYVMATDSGAEVRLVDHPALDMVMDWSPDGRFLLFASDRTGELAAWAIEISEDRPVGDPFLVKSSLPPGFVPVGFGREERFYFWSWNPRREVHLGQVDQTGQSLTVGAAPASASVAGANTRPAWSPDGSSLAFVRERYVTPFRSRQELVVRTLGSGVERSVEVDLWLQAESSDWSPDGRLLAFQAADRQRRQGVYLLDATTGEVARSLLADDDGAGHLRTPRFSPDGRSVYYRRQGDEYQLVRWDLASNERTVLFSTSDGNGFLTGFAVSPDGRWVAFGVSPNGNRLAVELMVVPAQGGEARSLFGLDVTDPALVVHAFTADSAQLLFTRDTHLWRVPVDGGAAERVFEFDDDVRSIVVSPDGRQLAVASRQWYSELWTIENLGLAAERQALALRR